MSRYVGIERNRQKDEEEHIRMGEWDRIGWFMEMH